MGFFKNLKEDFSQAMNELLPEEDLIGTDFMDDLDGMEDSREDDTKEEVKPKPKQTQASAGINSGRDLQKVLEDEVKQALDTLEDGPKETDLPNPAVLESAATEEAGDSGEYLDMDIFNQLLGEEQPKDMDEDEESLSEEAVMQELLSELEEGKQAGEAKEDEIISEEDLDLLFSGNDLGDEEFNISDYEPDEDLLFDAIFDSGEPEAAEKDSGGVSDYQFLEESSAPAENIESEKLEEYDAPDEVYEEIPDYAQPDTEPDGVSEYAKLDAAMGYESPDEEFEEILDDVEAQTEPDGGLESGELFDYEKKQDSKVLLEDGFGEEIQEADDTQAAREVSADDVEGSMEKTEEENITEEVNMDEIFNNAGTNDGDDADLDLIAQLLEEDDSGDVEEAVDEEIVARTEEEPKKEEAEPEPEHIEEEKRAANGDVTIITKGTVINGNITSDGSLEVNGTINGDIDCLGKLTAVGNITGNSRASEVYVSAARVEGGIVSTGSVKLGAGTVVIGDVKAASAVVAGAIKGQLDIEGPVVIDSTAIVKGNINAKSVQINNGAVVDGYCSLSYAAVDIDNFFDGDK